MPRIRERRLDDGFFEARSIANEGDLLHASCQRGIDQCMVKKLALGDDNCNAFELATLRFVNADGIGKLDATNQFAVREEVFLPFKIDCDADAILDARDSAEGAVQQAAVRIGEQMNDRFLNP